ncbi:type I methionyl aminopeptidase [soil metagenome]
MYTKVKTPSEIKSMRTSGRMLSAVLTHVKKQIEVGISTKDLADVATKELKALGGTPAFLGYQGFPDSLCVSVNNEVVHGIPSRNKMLASGDIVSMDFGVVYEDMITDSAISVIVGTADKKDTVLLEVTKKAMHAGIAVVKDGVRVGDIAAAVQSVLDKAGYGIVRDLVGHGVGHYVHEDPNIPNYGKAGTGPSLEAGMTIAIEPMATRGDFRVVVDSDGWTVKTADGSRAGHFEHTVLITKNGAEILTAV